MSTDTRRSTRSKNRNSDSTSNQNTLSGTQSDAPHVTPTKMETQMSSEGDVIPEATVFIEEIKSQENITYKITDPDNERGSGEATIIQVPVNKTNEPPNEDLVLRENGGDISS